MALRPVLLVLAAAGLAAVELSPVVGANCVLQRDRQLPIWGTGKPGEAVVVTFAGQRAETTVAADGTWSVVLPPQAASAEPRPLVVAGENTITADGILVGDVWICSGQSNMAWVVGQTLQAEAEVAAADLPTIRHLKIPNRPATVPMRELAAPAPAPVPVPGAQPAPAPAPALEWTICSPKTAAGFTAAGFYFARELAAKTKVPVGLISSNWGGTRIEPWIPVAGLRSDPSLSPFLAQAEAWDSTTETGRKALGDYLAAVKKWIPEAEAAMAAGKTAPAAPPLIGTGDHQQPTKLWNGMIQPLVPAAVAGFLWYQGESNGGESTTYAIKLKALVTSWRAAFRRDDLPFLVVQLANYQRSDAKNPAGGDGYAKIRDAQRSILALPATGLAVTIDIGDAGDIHPKNKQDVGLRLARWALKLVHGQEIETSGPLYREHAVEGAAIRVRFDHLGGGLLAARKEGLKAPEPIADGKIPGFAIAGEDKVWKWAEARIDGDSVVVSSSEVAAPVAVRYAFAATPPLGAGLYNRDGLPAAPFRTDSW